MEQTSSFNAVGASVEPKDAAGKPLGPGDEPGPGAGANLVFNNFKAGTMGTPTTAPIIAPINLTADTIKVMLVKSTLTPVNTSDFVNDLVAFEISGVSGYAGGFGGAGRKALAGRTLLRDNTNFWGIFDANDLTWTALGTGDTIGGAVLFKELTSDLLSPLIAYFALTNTPTNGGDVTVVWSSSPSGLLTLS